MKHRGSRLFLLTLVGAISLAGQEAPRASNPIQEVLGRYLGSIPPEDELQPFVGKTDAQDAVMQVLTSRKHQESWPGAIITLGIISSLDTPQGVDVKEKLVRYVESLEPFGCSADCKGLNRDSNSKLRHWDREARFKVPLALGYILRNTSSGSGQEMPIMETLLMIAEIGKGVLTNSSLCVTPAKTVDASCNQELQLNAVRGLEISGKRRAEFWLDKIAKINTNPLVSREAALAKDSIHPQR